MPYFLCTILCFLMVIPSSGKASAEPPATDAAILSGLLTEAVSAALDSVSAEISSEKVIRVSTGNGIELSARAKASIAAVCTRRGFSITDAETGVATLSVSVPDASVIVGKSGDELMRTVRMDLRIHCYDTSARLIYTDEKNFYQQDRFSPAFADATNDCGLFSPSLARTDIPHDNIWLRMTSASLLTGMLIWLAFK